MTKSTNRIFAAILIAASTFVAVAAQSAENRRAGGSQQYEQVKETRKIGSFSAIPADDGLSDEYCSNDPDDSHPPCDDGFKKACKDEGGTMSGTQGWGGMTCFKGL